MEESVNDHELAEGYREVVEPLWTVPVFEQVVDDIPLADHGTQLVAEARAGYVPVKLRERLDDDVRMIALDPKRSMIDAARERADEAGEDQIFFVSERVDAISYADGVFDAAVCLDGLVSLRQVAEGLDELARVVDDGGAVAVAAPLGDSFQVFYDLLAEALRAREIDDDERIGSVRENLATPPRMAAAAQSAGLELSDAIEVEWELEFETGRDFLESPLIRETFFPHWIGAIEPTEREAVLSHVRDALNTYWPDSSFTTTIRAGFVAGRLEAS